MIQLVSEIRTLRTHFLLRSARFLLVALAGRSRNVTLVVEAVVTLFAFGVPEDQGTIGVPMAVLPRHAYVKRTCLN